MELKVFLTTLVLVLYASTTISSILPANRENDIDLTQERELDSIDLSMYGERIFGYPDNKTGELVAAFNGNFKYFAQNPEELGNYLEGDILIPNTIPAAERNGILAKSYRWAGGIVPYEIKGSFSSYELSIIRHAMSQYHSKTCIRFRPRTTERDYISIVNANTGCWSSVGRLGGRQEVNLQSPNCLRTYGTPIHELMHALGFFHEQNRSERDSYVRVNNANIKPGMTFNFAKYSSKTAYGFGVNYDYASVMHYSPMSFSTNGKPTLEPLYDTKESKLMGQRRGFSNSDIAKINAMYRCK